jgi:hypothetical protein
MDSEAIPDDVPQYPGGEHSPAYRIAFQAWVAIFLLVICTSLLHYLGSWVQSMYR